MKLHRVPAGFRYWQASVMNSHRSRVCCRCCRRRHHGPPTNRRSDELVPRGPVQLPKIPPHRARTSRPECSQRTCRLEMFRQKSPMTLRPTTCEHSNTISLAPAITITDSAWTLNYYYVLYVMIMIGPNVV